MDEEVREMIAEKAKKNRMEPARQVEAACFKKEHVTDISKRRERGS